LKIFDGFVESFFGPLVPVMTTFQVEAISFGVVGLAFGEPFFLCPGEL
jgi:hypothetical protein